MTYGELIKKIRMSKNLSLRDFSKLVDVSFSHVRYLEKEQVGDVRLSPDIEMLKQICDRTGYSFRQFLEEAGYIETIENKSPDESKDLSKFTHLLENIDLSNVKQEHLEKALIAFRDVLQDLNKTDN